MDTLFIENSIAIKAPAAKVWDALVNPEMTKRYMFGCEALSDWKEGSPLIWRMDYEGKDFVAVKGEVAKIRSEEYLAYTVIDPNSSDIPDIPENYLTVSYELIPENGQTVLKVRQGDYSTVADGERRYRESYNNGEGWNPILVQIRDLVENS